VPTLLVKIVAVPKLEIQVNRFVGWLAATGLTSNGGGVLVESGASACATSTPFPVSVGSTCLKTVTPMMSKSPACSETAPAKSKIMKPLFIAFCARIVKSLIRLLKFRNYHAQAEKGTASLATGQKCSLTGRNALFISRSCPNNAGFDSSPWP
jgi:hypothetical protein